MDYRKLLKALVVLVIGIFMGKPIVSAVGGAVDAYEAAATTKSVVAEKATQAE